MGAISTTLRAVDSIATLAETCDSCHLNNFQAHEWLVFQAKQQQEFKIQKNGLRKLPHLLEQVKGLDSTTRLNLKWDIELRKGHYYLSIDALDKAFTQYKSIVDSIGLEIIEDEELFTTISVCLQKLGVIQTRKANYHEAIDHFKFAIDYEIARSEKLKKKASVYTMYALMAQCFYELENFVDAKKHFEYCSKELFEIIKKYPLSTIREYSHIFTPLLLSHAEFSIEQGDKNNSRKLLQKAGLIQPERLLKSQNLLPFYLKYHRTFHQIDSFHGLFAFANETHQNGRLSPSTRFNIHLEKLQLHHGQRETKLALSAALVLDSLQNNSYIVSENWAKHHMKYLSIKSQVLIDHGNENGIIKFYEKLLGIINNKLSEQIHFEDHMYSVSKYASIIELGLEHFSHSKNRNDGLFFKLIQCTKSLALYKELNSDISQSNMDESKYLKMRLLQQELADLHVRRAKSDTSIDTRLLIYKKSKEIKKAQESAENVARISHTSLKQFQSQLIHNEAALMYFAGKENYYSILITNSDMTTKIIESAELDSLLTTYFGHISQNQDYELTTELGQLLYSKLNLSHDKYRLLTVFPDGLLNLLPFESLVTNRNRYLIEDIDVRYNLSVSISAAVSSDPLKSNNVSTAIYQPDFKGTDGIYLKYAEQEARWLQSISHGELHSGSDITKESFASTCSSYSLIHLATHAKFNHERPELSFIQFAKRNKTEDQYLYFSEIKSLPLQCELISLSACETGIGLNYNSEGLQNLARNFTIAGAKSVISSLWIISDQTTKEIMNSFYSSIFNGASKSKALCEAKRKYLSANDDHDRHPYYWAAILLTGNDAPLLKKGLSTKQFMLFGSMIFLFIVALVKLKKTRQTRQKTNH